MTMLASLPPGLLLILGALVVPLLKGPVRAGWMLLLPVAGLLHLLVLQPSVPFAVPLFGAALEPVRIDQLALVFGYIFHLAAFLNVIYGLHEDDPVQGAAGLAYAGAAIGAVFAGDLLTLFVYWELTAISSVFLILARGTDRAYRAALRYLAVQVGSGVILLAGVVVHFQQTGSLAFGKLGLDSPGGPLILLAFGIKCAFPLLHNWLQDAYPEATVTGTVWLSAFTTKLAVYALARGFPGTEMLVWIGATMTAFPIFYAVIENDLRRVLAYSLNNQLGFMVVGIGIGTELALNGTVSHAFTHILYKALLFMSMGAVLLRTGTVNGSDLGGLYKSMPWTAGFCMVGAASISAFPLFSGFISKSMIVTAAADEGHWVVWLVLLFASAGVFHHSGIKIPYFAFFGHDSGKRCREAPWNMLLAMALAAALCIGIGIWPQPLYDILPYPVDYVPYTVTHVVSQLQLLLFSALAFAVLMRTGLYPPELRSTNLDVDWLYRGPLRDLVRGLAVSVPEGYAGLRADVRTFLGHGFGVLLRQAGPLGALARTWTTGGMVLWVVVTLGAALLIVYG